jgi:hypothetical protein
MMAVELEEIYLEEVFCYLIEIIFRHLLGGLNKTTKSLNQD